MISAILWLLVPASGSLAAEGAECRCRHAVSFQPLPAATLLLSAVAKRMVTDDAP